MMEELVKIHLKPVIKKMVRKKKGSIVTISSVSGLIGNRGQVNYSAAKAGMFGFTKSLAQEVGSRGITVNAVAPGFIDTDMTKALPDEQREALIKQIPLNQLGQPEDIANAVAFLASLAALLWTYTSTGVLNVRNIEIRGNQKVTDQNPEEKYQALDKFSRDPPQRRQIVPPIVNAEQRPRDRSASPRPHIERPTLSQTGLVVKHELVVGKPSGTDRLDRTRVITLVQTPSVPVLKIEIGSVSEVKHVVTIARGRVSRWRGR